MQIFPIRYEAERLSQLFSPILKGVAKTRNTAISVTTCPFLDALWTSDANWWQRSELTLAQVMACCLKAPSHYLNQCWLITKGVLWHSNESNFTRSAHQCWKFPQVRRSEADNFGGGPELFVDFSSILCLWLEIQGMRTYNFFDWISNTGAHVLDLYLVFVDYILTHLLLVPHICIRELGQHWLSQWLVAYSAPSHCLNQCWPIVNWTPGNKFQWNLNRNSVIFIQENAFENVVCHNGGHFVQEEMS